MKKILSVTSSILFLLIFSCIVVFADSNTVSPEDFGAVGDGIANDTAAVLNAILSGNTVEGKPDSKYLVNEMRISKNISYKVNNCNFIVPSTDEWSVIFDFIYSPDVHFSNCNFTTTTDKKASETIAFYMNDIESENISNVCFIRTRNLNALDYNFSVDNCTFENSGMDIITKSNQNDHSAGTITIRNSKSTNSVNAFSLSNAAVYNIENCNFYEHREGNKYAHPIYIAYGGNSTCNVKNTFIDFCSSGGIRCYHNDNYTLNLENVTMVDYEGKASSIINNTSRGSKTFANNCRFYAPEATLFNVAQVADYSTHHQITNSSVVCKYANVYNNSYAERFSNVFFENCNLIFTNRGILGTNTAFRNCNIIQDADTSSNIIASTNCVAENNYIRINTERENSLRFQGDCSFKNNSILFGGSVSPKTIVYSTGENNVHENNSYISWDNHRIYGGTQSDNKFNDTKSENILSAGWIFASLLKNKNEVFFDDENSTIKSVVFGKISEYENITKNAAAIPVDAKQSGKINAYFVENCDGKTFTVYVLSDETIFLNPSCDNMFNGFSVLEKIVFENVDFSLVAFSNDILKNSKKISSIYTLSGNRIFDFAEDLITAQDKNVSLHGKLIKSEEIPSTCLKEGVAEHYTCSICNRIFLDENANVSASDASIIIKKLPHTEAAMPTIIPTCEHGGSDSGVRCSVCGQIIVPPRITAKRRHSDDNFDGKCDFCGFAMQETKCSCRCHKNDFIWKILRFFYRIFSTNKYCKCNAQHY